eukprot:83939-Hanusia_phi.AAC.15
MYLCCSRLGARGVSSRHPPTDRPATLVSTAHFSTLAQPLCQVCTSHRGHNDKIGRKLTA